MIDIIVNFLSCIIYSIIVFDFMERFFERKFTCSVNIPFCLLTLMQFIANCFHIIAINYISTFIYFTVIAVFLYKSKKYNIYLVSLILMVLLIGIEMLILTVILFFFSHYMDYEEHYPIRAILSLVFTLIFYYFILIFFNKKNIFINKYAKIDIAIIFACFTATIAIVYLVDNELTTTEIIAFFVIAITILLVCLYVILVIDIKSQNQELVFENDEQNEKLKIYHNLYKEKLTEIEKKEKFYHDLKNHLQVLNQLYITGETDRVNKYFKKMNYEIPTRERIVSNDILQIMLNDLQMKCEKENIKLDLSINKTISLDQLEEIDLVTIFSNLISNAVESSKHCDKDKRKISVSIDLVNNFIIVRILNTFNHELKKAGDDFISSKKNHKGYGIKNIINKIEKYNGTYSIITNNDIFEFRIILPIQ